MARITIVTPTGAGTRTGNLHTAQRYARFLRGAGHRVSVRLAFAGHCDLLVALHAKRSLSAIESCKKSNPDVPVLLVLTGTDLYRDLPASREARRSLELADRLIVLQEDAKRRVQKRFRRKTRIVYQSSNAAIRRQPPKDRFRVVVVGHLRDEKDPFRAVLALSHLRDREDLEVVQVGGALAPAMSLEARQWQSREPRYRWLGSVPHARTLGWIARSHVLVVSSVMEGGANVICEAARIGTPVLASRVSGNLGMLGRNYPGYYRLFDEKGLAVLVEESSRKKSFYLRLKRGIANRRRLFAPAAERRGLLSVLRELDLRL